MSRPALRSGVALAAAALALALALAARPARAADAIAAAEEEISRLDRQLQALEANLAPAEEAVASRAARRLALGERRFHGGDFAGAAAALAVAVDDLELRRSAQLPEALFQLAESLRRLGRPAAALARFRELLALPGAPLRREALPRAMDCALRLGKPRDAEALLDAAGGRAAAEPPPAEALYLAAKAAYRRADRAPAARWAAALDAARAVPAPYHLHAAYLEGAVEVQRGALPQAEAAFGRCLAAEARDGAQRDVRELCRLALGRIAAEQGRFPDADRQYRDFPRRSPRFAEAVQEHAQAAVRAGKIDEAARIAGLLPGLQPESPLAPRSALLEGQLLLRSGRSADAVAAFERVVRTYAPLRDDLDRALASDAGPARWYAALAGPGPGRPEPPPLPRIALRWVKDEDGVAGVLAAAAALGDAEKELAEARRRAQRVEGALARNYGLGAFPALEESYARAEALETAAMKVSGALAAQEAEAMSAVGDAAIQSARGARRVAAQRLGVLPRTPEEMAARQRRDRERLAGLGRQVLELRAAAQAAQADADDVDVALFARPRALPRERDGVAAQLRGARRALADDLRALEQLGERVTAATDGAPRAGRPEEDKLRAAYRAAVDQELDLASQAASKLAALPPEVTRADRVRGRASEVEARADRAKRAVLKEARRRAAALRAELDQEAARLADEEKRLAAARGDTERAIGAASKRVFREVRRRLHEVVLQADVGIVDVAWAEKQRTGEKLQAAAARNAAELSALQPAKAEGR